MQRQYEALPAYLVEEEPSADVARRFGYSPGAFRVLCYQFRHDPQKRASFFRLPQRGPQSSPARDRVSDLAGGQAAAGQSPSGCTYSARQRTIPCSDSRPQRRVDTRQQNRKFRRAAF